MGNLIPSGQPAAWLVFLLAASFIERVARHTLLQAVGSADESLYDHLIL